MKALVTAVRQVEAALGKPVKTPAPCELKNRPVARKSLVASVAVKRGELFSAENLAAKRPGTGISPMRYWEILGSAASKNYRADEPIR